MKHVRVHKAKRALWYSKEGYGLTILKFVLGFLI